MNPAETQKHTKSIQWAISARKDQLNNRRIMPEYVIHQVSEMTRRFAFLFRSTPRSEALVFPKHTLIFLGHWLTDWVFPCAKHIEHVFCPLVNNLSYWDGWCSTKDPCFLSESLTATQGLAAFPTFAMLLTSLKSILPHCSCILLLETPCPLVRPFVTFFTPI